ncbi:hypothetical protein [Chromobacterium vaccinii]|uniref:hypothetical protein n=1 Tax=Chromobacterium vaccinii TaxID=1108595 RepID=UPI003457DC6E
MKSLAILTLVLLPASLVYADQLQDRVNRANSLQLAEDNAKLCQLGSPLCNGPSNPVPVTNNSPALSPSGSPIAPSQPPLTGEKITGTTRQVMAPSNQSNKAHTSKPGRPTVTGVSIIGSEKIVEARYAGQTTTLQVGESLGGWRLIKVDSTGVEWQRASSSGKKDKKRKYHVVRESFSSSSALAPIIIH